MGDEGTTLVWRAVGRRVVPSILTASMVALPQRAPWLPQTVDVGYDEADRVGNLLPGMIWENKSNWANWFEAVQDFYRKLSDADWQTLNVIDLSRFLGRLPTSEDFLLMTNMYWPSFSSCVRARSQSESLYDFGMCDESKSNPIWPISSIKSMNKIVARAFYLLTQIAPQTQDPIILYVAATPESLPKPGEPTSNFLLLDTDPMDAAQRFKNARIAPPPEPRPIYGPEIPPMVAIQRKREEQEARDKRINEFQSRNHQILKKYLEDQAPERKGGNGLFIDRLMWRSRPYINGGQGEKGQGKGLVSTQDSDLPSVLRISVSAGTPLLPIMALYSNIFAQKDEFKLPIAIPPGCRFFQPKPCVDRPTAHLSRNLPWNSNYHQQMERL